MSFETKNIRHLAARVSRGDSEAALELQEHLKPLMTRLLRQALRSDNDNSSLTHRLQTGVDEVCNGSWAHLDRSQEQFPALVSRRMCDLVINRLRSGLATVAE